MKIKDLTSKVKQLAKEKLSEEEPFLYCQTLLSLRACAFNYGHKKCIYVALNVTF